MHRPKILVEQKNIVGGPTFVRSVSIDGVEWPVFGVSIAYTQNDVARVTLEFAPGSIEIRDVE